MTLDDAIVAFGQLTSDDFDRLELDVRDYERLVKWLTELKFARESAFSDIGLAARAVSENNQLKAENTKLRELAKAAWGCVNRRVSCDECRMSCGGCTLQSAMRELGIEVD